MRIIPGSTGLVLAGTVFVELPSIITGPSNGTKTEKSIEKILQEHATINGTDLELVSEHWPAG